MSLHVVLIRPGIRTSERFARLTMFERDFFYGLLSYANKGGWFEANAKLLRAALYAPCLGKVSEREIRDGLLKMREVHLLKLWTGRNGRAYGSIVNYGQRYHYGEGLPDDAHPPDDELPLEAEPAADVPPDPPSQRVEMSVSRARETRRAPSAPTRTHESDSAWLKRLGEAHPDVNIEAELRRAERYVRQKRGDGARVTRKFFEAQWLAGCVDEVDVRAATSAVRPPVVSEPEPDGWREQIAESQYGPGGNFEVKNWAELPADVRALVRQRLAKERAA